MDDCAQALHAGNRVRLAVSTTFWPMIWPSPEPVTLTLHAGRSRLELPVRPPRAGDAELRDLGAGAGPIAGNAESETLEVDLQTGALAYRRGQETWWVTHSE